MSEIRAIETKYNGYRFRSRLEARWAVFFDACGIKYEYEPEGYTLLNGSAYLPDFYFPEMYMFGEVKPEGGDFSKAIEFAKDLPLKNGAWCIFALEGLPKLDFFDGFSSDENRKIIVNKFYFVPIIMADGIKTRAAISDYPPWFDENISYETRFDVMFWNCKDPKQIKLVFERADKIKQAVTIASSARFEFGETPKFGGA